jgi:hypothetical protein
MGNDSHIVVSHKLYGFQGCVGGRFVVMNEPIVVEPKSRSFFVAYFLSSDSKRHSKNQELTVVLVGTNSPWTVPFASKKTKQWTCSLLNSGPALLFFCVARGDCGFFYCDDCCFVSLKSHVYASLLLIISQDLGNKLRGSAAHVQIFW